ncbi:MAG: hypothetical protein CL946_13045 [Ectothiorhodospiraceae bacterium]|nr:hypothetical protein [Ectothiorhodospiraceae bacterium]
MRKHFGFLAAIVALTAFFTTAAQAQDPRPELMYFRFDEPGQSSTPNKAAPGTAVTPQATIQGNIFMGGTGQFGSALVGVGGTTADVANTGWGTSLSGSWTMSFYLNNISGSAFGYYWGDPTASGFRCFNAGAAGTNNLLMRGPLNQVVVTGITPGPTVVHFVYDQSAGEIRAYKNGILNNTVSQGSVSISGSGPFGIGAYGGTGGSGGMPNGTLLDEFRLYNRALTQQEISDTWDEDVDCFFDPGLISAELTDAGGVPTPFANAPGSVYIKYSVAFPDTSSPVTLTLNLRDIQTDAIVYSAMINDVKPDGAPLNGIQQVNIPSTVPPGVYSAEIIVNSRNSCKIITDLPLPPSAFFVLAPGSNLCIVWPGDTNDDMLVNYGDKKALASYIHEANLRSSWLTGPARFRPDAGTDPLTYIRWEAQPAVPWQTPEGCYMDTDGNGVINNFDNIAIRMNWMRSSDGATKSKTEFAAGEFDMSQNFPNPFNPSTKINVSVPERSAVRVVVMDVLGREVATLAEGEMEAGVQTLSFDASGFESGVYFAVATMQGTESGLSFNKTIRMTLNK